MRSVFLILALFASIKISAQQAGVNIYYGFSNGQFSNELLTPPNSIHAGYLISVEARLTDGPSYMLASANYHKVGLIASEDAEYFNHNYSLNWFKARTGIGFKVFSIASSIDIHSKILGSVNILNSFPNVANPLPFEEINTYTFGGSVGITAFVSFLSVGFEYEKAFTELVKDAPYTSNFDVWSLTGGVFF